MLRDVKIRPRDERTVRCILADIRLITIARPPEAAYDNQGMTSPRSPVGGSPPVGAAYCARSTVSYSSPRRRHPRAYPSPIEVSQHPPCRGSKRTLRRENVGADNRISAFRFTPAYVRTVRRDSADMSSYSLAA